jgi:hypothetical protein
MSLSRAFVVLGVSAFIAACGTIDVIPNPVATLRVINATNSALTVLIDGQTSFQGGVTRASVSPEYPLVIGSHTVQLQTAAGTSTMLTVDASDGIVPNNITVAATPTTGSNIAASVVVDTGTIVPAGKSKLRVLHLAAGAPALEIWRTQPDFHTGVHIMTPFPYQGQSPYLQSDPGDWEVWVTAPNSTAKIATTGAITVPNGERRTVVLLDSAGVVRFRVLNE